MGGAILIATRLTRDGEGVRGHGVEIVDEGVCRTVSSRVLRRNSERQRLAGGLIASPPPMLSVTQSPVGQVLFAVCLTATIGRHGRSMFTTSSERVPPIRRALRRSGTRHAITGGVENSAAIMPDRTSQI